MREAIRSTNTNMLASAYMGLGLSSRLLSKIISIGFMGDYSTVYFVRSPFLLETERLDGIFDGSILAWLGRTPSNLDVARWKRDITKYSKFK